MRPEQHPTRTMTALGVGFGSLAVLLPLALIEPTTPGAAALVALLAVGLLSTGSVSRRVTHLTSLVLAPLFGAAIVTTTVAHVDPAAVLAGPEAVHHTTIATGAVAGLMGAVALSLLFGNATRTVTSENVRSAGVESLRVAMLFGLAAAVMLTILRLLGSVEFGLSFEAAISRIASADQIGSSFVILLVWAVLPAFALNLYRSIQRLVSTPLESAAARGDDIGDKAATAATESTDTWSNYATMFSLGVLGLAFVRLIASTADPAEQDPRLAEALITSEALGEAIRTEFVVSMTMLILLGMFACRTVVAAVGWARRQHDQSDRVLTPTTSMAMIVAGMASVLFVGAPAYGPAAETRLLALDVPPTLVAELVEYLPAVILGVIAICAGVAGVSFSLVRMYGGTLSNGATDWLVYRNLVFLTSATAIIAATIYGVMPLAAFVAMVAALLTWDFLEYGYTLAAELRSGRLQPPEIAHAAASVGVGVVLVGVTLGVHHVGQTFAPPAAISYLAVPLLVLAVALLLVYFNSE